MHNNKNYSEGRKMGLKESARKEDFIELDPIHNF
jgi:hypothetical protein